MICFLTSPFPGLTSTILGRWWEGHISIERTNNGILGGLVSITAGCAVVNPEIAFVIGVIGGAIYFLSSRVGAEGSRFGRVV